MNIRSLVITCALVLTMDARPRAEFPNLFFSRNPSEWAPTPRNPSRNPSCTSRNPRGTPCDVLGVVSLIFGSFFRIILGEFPSSNFYSTSLSSESSDDTSTHRLYLNKSQFRASVPFSSRMQQHRSFAAEIMLQNKSRWSRCEVTCARANDFACCGADFRRQRI